MRKLVAGNWKMNGLRADAIARADALVRRVAERQPQCDLLLCPPATLLVQISAVLGASGIALGGQDCHPEPKGAHTGDIAAPMLKDCGCSHIILGHSERRADHHETDALVRAKLEAARAAGLVPIVCVGETAAQRDGRETLAVIGRQLQGSLPEGLGIAPLVIAYEPVWAIGSGGTPTAAEVADVHGFIRVELGTRVADPSTVPILYGGSVNARNAGNILTIANVDGALVGGASLDAEAFWTIATCAGGEHR
ncbi:MAG: triose-phosphate isomerase [Stellaceae bacterium]